MIVERATEKYYADILVLVKEFYKEALSAYGADINEECLLASFDKYKANAFLAIVDGKCVGLLAGDTVKDVLNGDKIFQEVIWYVSEAHRTQGVRLLREAEKMIKADGCVSMVMVCLHNSNVEKITAFYNRLGYKPMETHFIKMLGDSNAESN